MCPSPTDAQPSLTNALIDVEIPHTLQTRRGALLGTLHHICLLLLALIMLGSCAIHAIVLWLTPLYYSGTACAIRQRGQEQCADKVRIARVAFAFDRSYRRKLYAVCFASELWLSWPACLAWSCMGCAGTQVRAIAHSMTQPRPVQWRHMFVRIVLTFLC